jgi:hypothetical protein
MNFLFDFRLHIQASDFLRREWRFAGKISYCIKVLSHYGKVVQSLPFVNAAYLECGKNFLVLKIRL